MQPDDADFDTLDFGGASVRWMTNAQPAFGAIGPSQVDPRSGEILDADIGIESLSSRNLRALRSQVLAGDAASTGAALMQAPARADRRTARAARGPTARRRTAATPTWRPSSSATRSTCSRRAATSTPAAPRRSSSCSTT